MHKSKITDVDDVVGVDNGDGPKVPGCHQLQQVKSPSEGH